MLLNGLWALIPLYVSTKIGEESLNQTYFTYSLSAFNLGALLGGYILSRQSEKLQKDLSYTLFFTLFVATLAVSVLVNLNYLSFIFLGMTGFFGSILGIALQAHLISALPSSKIGGVGHTVSSLSNLFTPVWLAVFSLLNFYLHSMYAVLVLTGVTVTLLFLGIGLQKLRSHNPKRRPIYG